MATATETKNGRIAQIIGSTFDAEFPEGHLPEIYNAVRVDSDFKGTKIRLTGEVISAPYAVQRSRSPWENPGRGGTTPMLAAAASVMTQAISSPTSSKAICSAVRSL